MKEKANPLTPYYNAFQFELKKLAESEYIGSVYMRLFSIKEVDELETELAQLHKISLGEDSCYGEYGIENWFAIWHKSIRQTDYFTNVYSYREVDKLTDGQKIDLRTLRDKAEKLRKKIVFELPKNCNDEDIKHHEESYKLLGQNKEYNDLIAQIRTLRKIEKTHEDLHLAGILDAILHDIVNVDTNALFKVFKYTFNYVKTAKEIELLTENK